MARSWSYLPTAVPFGFAHRGGDGGPAGPGLENSMAAFEHAVELGYRYLETDVHLSADGVLVAFHDDCLDRVTDRTGLIADLTWDEIRQARIGGREPIPLFEDLLLRWPDVYFNIDPKCDAAVEPLIDLLRRHDVLDRVCVGSFVDKRLATIRKAFAGNVCTSPGPRSFLRVYLRSFGLPVPLPRVGCVQVAPTHYGVRIVTRRFVRRAHRLGLQVHVWTINDEAEMHRLLDLGVDALMTDDVALLKHVLQDRGQWNVPPAGDRSR